MRILIVAPYYIPYVSGMTIYVQQLAENFVKRGHGVTILTHRHLKNLPNQEIVNGVKIFRVPVAFGYQRGVFAPTFMIHLSKLVKKHDVINIHTPFFEVGMIALVAYVMSNRRPILTYHCDLVLKSGILSRVVEKIYYSSVMLATKITERIVVNSMDYARTSKVKNSLSKTVQIIPPIDTSKFHKIPVTGFREKYGLKENDVIVGFLGRLVREKGLEYLIQADPDVLKEIPNVKFIIAGEGEKVAGGRKESEKEKLLKLTKKLRLGNVIFTGHLTNEVLLEFYSVCDVFVLPSIDPLESFGMVKVEALLCDVPIVVADMPGLRETIDGVEVGLIVPPRNSKELAIAIATILRNKDKFLVPRKMLLKSFGVDKTAREYEKIFRKQLE